MEEENIGALWFPKDINVKNSKVFIYRNEREKELSEYIYKITMQMSLPEGSKQPEIKRVVLFEDMGIK